MSNKERLKTIMSREEMNTTPQCPACGRNFTMGEPVVKARGDWDGQKLIHEHDALFDERTNTYIEKNYFDQGMIGKV